MSALAPPPRERRRHHRGLVSRLLTGPIPIDGIGSGVRRWAARLVPVALAVLLVGGAGLLIARLWSSQTPWLTPRHRPEALCFALAAPPPFAPPMPIEPSAALVRGRFSATTPASLALREAMNFTDDMVISERRTWVGDFEVSSLWLLLPPATGGRHWLVVGWMEGSDLAMCSFRFASDEIELSADERAWGDRLLGRILISDHFHAGVLPSVRLHARPGAPLPSFGPKPAS